MKKNKKLLEIEVPADGKSGVSGGGWGFFFMYTKYHGNFLLKGYWREVEEYIKKENYGPYFYNRLIFWKGGWGQQQSWSSWEFWKKGIRIYSPDKMQRKYVIKPVDNRFDRIKTRGILEYRFKRMPNRWIPKFDLL